MPGQTAEKMRARRESIRKIAGKLWFEQLHLIAEREKKVDEAVRKIRAEMNSKYDPLIRAAREKQEAAKKAEIKLDESCPMASHHRGYCKTCGWSDPVD